MKWSVFFSCSWWLSLTSLFDFFFGYMRLSAESEAMYDMCGKMSCCYVEQDWRKNIWSFKRKQTVLIPARLTRVKYIHAHARGSINTFINTSINNATYTLVTSDPLAFAHCALVHLSSWRDNENNTSNVSARGLGNSSPVFFFSLFNSVVVFEDIQVADGTIGSESRNLLLQNHVSVQLFKTLMTNILFPYVC